jgi:uncharacterized protein YbjT (DUF2867 family)
MIVVAGGSGRLGRALLARRPNARSISRREGVDVRDRSALDLRGATVVVSAMHGFAGKGVDPESVDVRGNANLIEAAAAAGVRHFILVSVHDARADHPIELFRAKFRAEELLRASGLPYTIVRPSAFVETWLGIVCAPLLEKKKTMIFGRGRNPINFVSVDDIATVIDDAIDRGPLGNAIECVGPDNLTFHELLDAFCAITGARGRVGHVPLPVMRTMAIVMRPFHANLARQIRAGVVLDTTDMAATPATVTSTVRDAIAREYRA